MNDFNVPLWVTISMWALPVGVGLLLVYLIVADVIYGIRSKRQQKRFAELYEMCIEKHGLIFAQKLYNACRDPLWIGMDKLIAVFEHHCGIENELSKKLRQS